MMKITQFRSSFDHSLVTFVDYDFNASPRAKRKILHQLQELGAVEYFKAKRPDVYADMVKATT